MRSEKFQMLEAVKEMEKANAFFVIGFKALTVAEFSKFRVALAAIGAKCHVVKNSLIRKAAESLNSEKLAAENLTGASAVVYGNDDAVAIAKAITDLIKDTPDAEKKPRVAIKCGLLEGQFLSSAEVAQLATLPPREVLLAQLLGLLQAPASQLVRVLNAKVSSIVYVLNAFLEKQKEQSA